MRPAASTRFRSISASNVVPAVDPKTGATTINPIVIAGDGETKLVCPRAGGAKNWLPASHDPGTKIL